MSHASPITHHPIYLIGKRVRVKNCPGLDGVHIGIITGRLHDGYEVRVTGPYFCGTNATRKLKTETNYIEADDILGHA